MTRWGVNAYENDTAADWEQEVLLSDDLTVVDSALGADLENLREEEGERVVAAAALVAAAFKENKGELTPELSAWVNIRKEQLRERSDSALEALGFITDANSELLEIWKRSPQYEAWLSGIEDMRERIGLP